MLEADPPEDTRLRRLAYGAFSPKRSAEPEPRITEIAAELLQALPESGELDLVEAWAGGVRPAVRGSGHVGRRRRADRAATAGRTGRAGVLGVPFVEEPAADVFMGEFSRTAALDVEKIDPAEFVRVVLDGVEREQSEIVADDLSRRAKAALAHDPSLLAP
jgi:hypothetical protein